MGVDGSVVASGFCQFLRLDCSVENGSMWGGKNL